MIPRGLPLHRWPLRYHMGLACLVLAGGVAGSLWWLHRTQAAWVAAQTDLLAVQGRLAAAARATPPKALGDYTQALPAAARAEDVHRDMARLAQSHGLLLNTLTVEARAATASELGRVQFSVVAQADYRAVKAWLADLLGRYPSLGVQSLALHALPNELARLEIRALLVLYVKD